MKRPWRGATLHVEIERVAGLKPGEVEVRMDGQPLEGGVLGEVRAGAEVRVRDAWAQRPGARQVQVQQSRVHRFLQDTIYGTWLQQK